MKLSRETLTVGIVAILCGLIAAYAIRSYLMQPEIMAVKPPPVPPPLTVPLASEDLPADRLLTVGDISLVPIPRQQFRERFKGVNVTLIMMSSKDIVGRRLREPVRQGQPFLTTSLYLQGSGPSLTDRLPAGFRAVSLTLTDSHGGNVQPGTRVDVVFRARPRPAKGLEPAIPEMTVTLLRHIEVLETNRPTTQTGPEGKSLVTLAIPTDKVRIFSTVEDRGEIWLVAASPQEEKPEQVTHVLPAKLTLEDILGIEPIKPPPPPPTPFQTAIYRRGAVQVNTFVDGKLVSRAGTWTSPQAAPAQGGSGATPGCPTCGKPPGAAALPLTPTPAVRGDGEPLQPVPPSGPATDDKGPF